MAYRVIRSGWIPEIDPADHWRTGTSLTPHLEVDDVVHLDTGLVTSEGDRIFRTQPPIGFGRDHEWD